MNTSKAPPFLHVRGHQVSVFATVHVLRGQNVMRIIVADAVALASVSRLGFILNSYGLTGRFSLGSCLLANNLPNCTSQSML